MAQNTQPIFSLVPNVSSVTLTTTAANTSSAGGGTVGTDIFKAFTTGSNGSFINKVRFMSVASAAATTGVATTLRIFVSSVGSGSTSASDTFLIGEVSVPAINSDNSTNATNYYDFIINCAIPASRFIHVTQHVAQTTNQNWVATAFGGDY